MIITTLWLIILRTAIMYEIDTFNEINFIGGWFIILPMVLYFPLADIFSIVLITFIARLLLLHTIISFMGVYTKIEAYLD